MKKKNGSQVRKSKAAAMAQSCCQEEKRSKCCKTTKEVSTQTDDNLKLVQVLQVTENTSL